MRCTFQVGKERVCVCVSLVDWTDLLAAEADFEEYSELALPDVCAAHFRWAKNVCVCVSLVDWTDLLAAEADFEEYCELALPDVCAAHFRWAKNVCMCVCVWLCVHVWSRGKLQSVCSCLNGWICYWWCKRTSVCMCAASGSCAQALLCVCRAHLKWGRLLEFKL